MLGWVIVIAIELFLIMMMIQTVIEEIRNL